MVGQNRAAAFTLVLLCSILASAQLTAGDQLNRENLDAYLKSDIVRVGYSWQVRTMTEAMMAHRPVAQAYAFIFLKSPDLAVSLMEGGPAGMGKEVSKEMMFEAAKFLLGHPEKACMQLANNLIDEGLDEYRDGYRLYGKWKKTGTLTDEEKARFIKENAGISGAAKIVLGKDLFSDTLNYKYKTDAWEETRDALLDKVAEIERVSDTWDAAKTGNELAGVFAEAKEGLGEYPPFQAHMKRLQEMREKSSNPTDGADNVTSNSLRTQDSSALNRPIQKQAGALYRWAWEGEELRAVDVLLDGVRSVASGGWRSRWDEHTVVIKDDGSVHAWGAGDCLGDGSPKDRDFPVPVPGIDDAVAVACGEEHTVVLKADGTVWAWTRKRKETVVVLGTGESYTQPEQESLPHEVQIELGNNALSNPSAKSSIPEKVRVKYVEIPIAEFLPSATITNGQDELTVQEARNRAGKAANDFAITLAPNRDGYAPSFEAAAKDANLKVHHAGPLAADEEVPGVDGSKLFARTAFGLGDARDDYFSGAIFGESNVYVVALEERISPRVRLDDVIQVACGEYFSMALRNDGTVWAWGQNDVGQLGIGSRQPSVSPVQVRGLDRIKAIAAGSDTGMALRDDGTVWVWGWSLFGVAERADDRELRIKETPIRIPGLENARAVAAGRISCFVVLADGTVRAWGDNEHGELGDGTTEDRSIPVEVYGLTNVVGISASGIHTIALLQDGRCMEWGGIVKNGLMRPGKAVPEVIPNLHEVVSISAGYPFDYAVVATRSGQQGESRYLLSPDDFDGLFRPMEVDINGRLGGGLFHVNSLPLVGATYAPCRNGQLTTRVWQVMMLCYKRPTEEVMSHLKQPCSSDYILGAYHDEKYLVMMIAKKDMTEEQRITLRQALHKYKSRLRINTLYEYGL